MIKGCEADIRRLLSGDYVLTLVDEGQTGDIPQRMEFWISKQNAHEIYSYLDKITKLA